MEEKKKKQVSLWLLAVFAPILVAGIGSVIRPDIFYDNFIWQYLYGPIYADAMGEIALERNGVVANSGYTPINTAVYAYYLLLAVIGTVGFLEILDIGEEPRFFFSLVPYMFAGGALRAIEDTAFIPWPQSFFFISPIIYFTMFIATALVFLSIVYLQQREVIEDYAAPMAMVGTLLLALVLVILFRAGWNTGENNLWVLPAVLGLASILWLVIWHPVSSYIPEIKSGTGSMGAVLLWGHLMDASSTFIGVEYLGYGEKHPLVDFIISSTGTAASFIPVKAAVVLLILYLFNDEFFEESPRLAYLLMVAVLAIGLGPGTRNTMRATLGV